MSIKIRSLSAELELRDRSRAALEAQTRWQHAPW